MPTDSISYRLMVKESLLRERYDDLLATLQDLSTSRRTFASHTVPEHHHGHMRYTPAHLHKNLQWVDHAVAKRCTELREIKSRA